MNSSDFVIIGGGIVGATISIELRRRYSNSIIAILEKENNLGSHSSTNNSGVIQSGIYYDPDSVKARVCKIGAEKIKVRLKLYKGNTMITGRESSMSLYNPNLATFESDDIYSQKDAEGFIKLNALRLREKK